MPSWLVLVIIPASFAFICGLLALSAFVETSVLSPRSMISAAIRSRRAAPEFTEKLVTREMDRLLRNVQRG